jgi:transglutaminase-like putative cysteine protease
LARTLVVFALAGVLVSSAWLRLEDGAPRAGEALVMVALALLPALAAALIHRRLVTAVVLAASTLLAASVAFGVPLANARPGDRDTDFLDPVLASFRRGLLEFFDTRVPFDRLDFPLMHGVVLIAVFAFVAATALAVARGRPLLAATSLVMGVVWPATISESWVADSRPLTTGALTLAAVLTILFLVREGGRQVRGFWHAAVVGLVLVGVSVAASTSDAVAKTGFVRWQEWDLYDPPQDPVSVSYVWSSDYDGISFPAKKTVVLKIHVPGPERSLYWRATTLDEYSGTHWREDLTFRGGPEDAEEIQVIGRDPLLPERAGNEDDWVEQEVEVVGLRDSHLIGSAQAVKWRPGISPVELADNGAVVAPQQLRPGQRYTVWSYVPRVNPTHLADASTEYGPRLARYLRLTPTIDLPPFSTPSRDEKMRHILGHDPYVGGFHLRVYDVARDVIGDARSPYDAAVALEAWFRSDGGFVYDESPPPTYNAPPLAAFVLRDKRGYCQQFAGSMAIMLRLLGIPARVAAGFTSGTYDEGKQTWTVTDHNAHTWVEVYFPKFGWIPFDPTPNRGQLTAAYTPFSTAFDARDAARALAGGAAASSAVRRQLDRAREAENGFTPDVPGAAAPQEGNRGGRFLAAALLVTAAAIAALLVVKAGRRRLRFVSRDPRKLAAACRRDVVAFLADQGFDTPASATLAELGEVVERLYGAEATPFVNAATAARFARPRETGGAARRAQRELRALRREMRAALSLGQRVRGALSLRSLAV